jgi:uncharacterized phage protein gp47/JayE
VTDYGVTPTGFVAKTLEIIDAEMSDQMHANVDPTLDVSPDQPLGQIKSIFARQAAKLWELGATVYNAGNPNAAEDILLDNVCALTGTQREAATFSTVVLAMVLGSTATIPAGSTANVSGQPTNRWTLLGPATGPGGTLASAGPVVSTTGGTYYGVFQADTTGPRTAVAGTLSVITVPVTGWTSCTNPLDATIGTNRETDPTLRVRRESELQAAGSGAPDAIRADLLNVPGVIQAFVFENTTDYVDANSVPAHGLECVIYDGLSPAATNAAVSAVIWKDKPSGATLFGSVASTTTDSTGKTRPAPFSRASLRRVYISIPTLTTDSTYNAVTGPAAVKAALALFVAKNANLGLPVVALQLRAAALTVQGVTDVPTLYLDFSSTPVLTANLAIGTREIATLQTSDILIAGV